MDRTMFIQVTDEKIWQNIYVAIHEERIDANEKDFFLLNNVEFNHQTLGKPHQLWFTHIEEIIWLKNTLNVGRGFI